MQIPLQLRSLENFNIHRFLRRNFIERMVQISKILCLSITVLLLGYLFYSIYSTSSATAVSLEKFDRDMQKGAQSSLLIPPGEQLGSRIDLEKLARGKFFGTLGVSNVSRAPVATPKPAALLPLSLIGTFISDGQPAYAIIEEQKKRTQDVFLLNDMIFGEAKLTGILPDRVEIFRNGQSEVLLLDATPDGSDAGGSGAPEDSIVVDEAELDRALENLPLLLTQARAVPFFKEGRAVGLRLFAIRAGSLFEKIGLKNGDVLKTVNGNSLADLTQAMQLFQKLKEERSITLLLERNSAEKQFQYQIR